MGMVSHPPHEPTGDPEDLVEHERHVEHAEQGVVADQ
jgi:hypothetical protein